MSNYSEQRTKDLQLRTRDMLRELPDVCFDFINAIASTTQPLTRYAYVSDLKLFFGFLAVVVLLAVLGYFLQRRDAREDPSAQEEEGVVFSEKIVGNVHDLNDQFNRARYMDEDGV